MIVLWLIVMQSKPMWLRRRLYNKRWQSIQTWIQIKQSWLRNRLDENDYPLTNFEYNSSKSGFGGVWTTRVGFLFKSEYKLSRSGFGCSWTETGLNTNQANLASKAAGRKVIDFGLNLNANQIHRASLLVQRLAKASVQQWMVFY